MRVQFTNFCKNIKIKKQFLFFGSILLFFFNVNNIWAETKYSMTLIKNSNSPNGTTEFSIYIESKKNSFTLTSYQCAIRLGKIEQSSNEIFKYVDYTNCMIRIGCYIVKIVASYYCTYNSIKIPIWNKIFSINSL